MKVKVYSTQMGEKTVECSGQTWEDLQRDLMTAGVSYSGMKAVVGETKATLEAGVATLPEFDFTLFLMPVKTKSGIKVKDMSYKELRNEIKSAIEVGGDAAKTHFNKKKSYTNKSIDEMKKLLKKWNRENVSNQAEAVSSRPIADNTQKIINEDEEKNEVEHEILRDLSNGINLLKKVDVSKISPESQEEINVIVRNLEFRYVKLTTLVSKNSILERQYKELCKEFSDVKP